jgi:hypothetical protein
MTGLRGGLRLGSFTCSAAALAVAALLGGCGPSAPPIVPAGGVVRLDGKPLNSVEVVFVPGIEFGPEYVARGVTDEEGRFQLRCKGRPGACACEHRVMIVEAELPSELKGESLQAQQDLAEYLASLGGRPLPQKYASLVDSPLTVTVTAGRSEYVLDLTR